MTILGTNDWGDINWDINWMESIKPASGPGATGAPRNHGKRPATVRSDHRPADALVTGGQRTGAITSA
jgi:hypothetical protein